MKNEYQPQKAPKLSEAGQRFFSLPELEKSHFEKAAQIVNDEIQKRKKDNFFSKVLGRLRREKITSKSKILTAAEFFVLVYGLEKGTYKKYGYNSPDKEDEEWKELQEIYGILRKSNDPNLSNIIQSILERWEGVHTE